MSGKQCFERLGMRRTRRNTRTNLARKSYRYAACRHAMFATGLAQSAVGCSFACPPQPPVAVTCMHTLDHGNGCVCGPVMGSRYQHYVLQVFGLETRRRRDNDRTPRRRDFPMRLDDRERCLLWPPALRGRFGTTLITMSSRIPNWPIVLSRSEGVTEPIYLPP